ncbi:LOW QUALITY PROTEIN: hypothetical protein V2J09_015868 [Rumex salicifolius]
MQILQPGQQSKDTTALYCISGAVFFSLLLLFSLSSSSSPLPHDSRDPKLFNHPNNYLLNPNPNRSDPYPPLPPPPSFAYFLSGSAGDLPRLLRLLFAVYHPKSFYLLHLDAFAPQSERDQLALTVQSVPIFAAAKNVHVIGNPDFAYPKGSTPVSSVLRGASILLSLSSSWSWFINLSAKDYPLVTQDDLLHIFSYLPKELNFVNHTSYVGWREYDSFHFIPCLVHLFFLLVLGSGCVDCSWLVILLCCASRRLRPIVVDPGLYLKNKAAMFYATEKRKMPAAFQLFTGEILISLKFEFVPNTGSPMAILNRKFVEYCISGPDNLPRTLLMYFANTPSALLNYFPTVLCNSLQFSKTTVNHNLQFASFSNNPSKEAPRALNSTDFSDMLSSGSAFATGFPHNDAALDLIDRELLGRSPGMVVPGGWCLGGSNDTCAEWGDADILRPGPGAKRLEKRFIELLSNGNFRSQQCRAE